MSEIKVNGQSLPFIQNEAMSGSELARRGDDLVAVVFPAPLEKDKPLRVSLTYSGPVMFNAGGELLYVGARGTWYPNRGVAMSDFDLEFRTPAEWTLVATGKRVSQQNTEGTDISRWVSERPIPIAGFNLGRYVEARARTGSMVVEAFATKGMEKTFQPPTRAEIMPPPKAMA